MTVRHTDVGLEANQDEERTDMVGILSSWLTPGEVQDLVRLAGIGLLALLVRYVGAYALLTRCIRQTRPEDRSEVLHAVAEVLRSLRGKQSALRPADNEPAERVPPVGAVQMSKK
jgi:hypothetical protein